MISFLKGRKIFEDAENVTIDVNGVGYEVTCSQTTRSQIESLNEIELFIYTNVREDAITLFGFKTAMEKHLFLTLIKVNGVGPKMAISILSGAPVDKILLMIESEDVKALTQLPKVGKKTAEQLILSLKGKLPKLEANGITVSKKSFGGPRHEVLSALVNLGFRLQDVEKVVEEFKVDIEVEEGVRRGLQALSSL